MKYYILIIIVSQLSIQIATAQTRVEKPTITRPSTIEKFNLEDVEIEKPFVEGVIIDSTPDLLSQRLPINKPFLKYPPSLVKSGTEGYVILRFTVDAKGNTVDDSITVIESTHEEFSKSAINTAKNYKYKPWIVNGEAVPMKDVRIRHEFNIAKY